MGLINAVFELVMWLLILRAIADFVPPLAESAVGTALHRLTEPVLAPVRRIVRPVVLGEVTVDLSAVVIVLVVYYLRMLF